MAGPYPPPSRVLTPAAPSSFPSGGLDALSRQICLLRSTSPAAHSVWRALQRCSGYMSNGNGLSRHPCGLTAAGCLLRPRIHAVYVWITQWSNYHVYRMTVWWNGIIDFGYALLTSGGGPPAGVIWSPKVSATISYLISFLGSRKSQKTQIFFRPELPMPCPQILRFQKAIRYEKWSGSKTRKKNFFLENDYPRHHPLFFGKFFEIFLLRFKKVCWSITFEIFDFGEKIMCFDWHWNLFLGAPEKHKFCLKVST